MSTPNHENHAHPTDEGRAAADTQAALVELANSVALVPQAPAPEGQERPEGSLALPVIEQDGNRYIPVFTSEETLAAAGVDPAAAVRVPVAELAANWPTDDLWLAVDPSSDEGLALPSDLVRALPALSGAGSGPDGAGGPGT
jgi:hypothetical protein